LASQLVGSEFKYTVTEGDTLMSVGARLGIENARLAAMNDLKPKRSLKPGDVLRVVEN